MPGTSLRKKLVVKQKRIKKEKTEAIGGIKERGETPQDLVDQKGAEKTEQGVPKK